MTMIVSEKMLKPHNDESEEWSSMRDSDIKNLSSKLTVRVQKSAIFGQKLTVKIRPRFSDVASYLTLQSCSDLTPELQ